MLIQNRVTSLNTFKRITSENVHFRLNEQTASAGFIYRHVGETINLFGLFFGLPTGVKNTTMSKADKGQGQDLEASRLLVEQGFERLQQYVSDTPDSAWLDPIETPFFGTVSRARLFSHILFHNAHHAGQVALTLSKDK